MTFQDFISEFISNRILLAGACGWLTAQVLKTIIYAITNHGIDWTRLAGDGGMPSGHSATVTAIAVSCGIELGFDSALFALSFFFAIIVMHDAMGVRLETGKQAKLLNEMVRLFSKDNPGLSEERLKEFVGHTPAQVLIGCLTGCGMAFLLNLLYL